eukprot:PhF_6_TR32984/c0_g1_i1/m.48584
MFFQSALLILVGAFATAQAACTMRPPIGVNDTTLANYLIPNATTAPADWNITVVCDQYKQGDEVCCSHNQWIGMYQKLEVMDYEMINCAACNVIFKRLWCDFTCSPNQADFVKILSYVPGQSDNRIESVNMYITSNFADRLWASCQNAGLQGLSSFKTMFLNGVLGFLNMMSSKSPQTYQQYNLIADIPIDYSPNSLALNTSTVENDFACSRGHIKSNEYALPQATVGGIKLKFFVLIVFGSLLVLVLLLGVWNMTRQCDVKKEVEGTPFLSNTKISPSIHPVNPQQNDDGVH